MRLIGSRSRLDLFIWDVRFSQVVSYQCIIVFPNKAAYIHGSLFLTYLTFKNCIPFDKIISYQSKCKNTKNLNSVLKDSIFFFPFHLSHAKNVSKWELDPQHSCRKFYIHQNPHFSPWIVLWC